MIALRRGLPKRQQGVALFVTIVLVTVILIIASTLTYRHQLNSVRSSHALISEQAVLLALSAESWAKSILRNDAANNDNDSFSDDWAQVIPVLPVEGGVMTGCMVDMQSRYNINNLGYLDKDLYEQALADENDDLVEAYLNLLYYLELDSAPERAAVIIDWIDANTEVVVPGSAEDAEYSLENPPRLAGNAPLTSVSELVTVYGYSLADIRALDRFVVALPVQTAVNINTAPVGVLQSLSTLIDDFVVEGLLEQRPYENLSVFYQALEEEISFMPLSDIQSQLPEELITVSSNFFELRVQVEIGGENVALTSLFQRNGGSDVRTLARTFQYIPDLVLEEGDENPIRPLCDQSYGLELDLEGEQL